MAIRKEETPKMGFPLPAIPYLAENLSGLKIFRSLSFMRECTTKLEEIVINLSITSYSNLENIVKVINILKDQVKELAVQKKKLPTRLTVIS